MAKKGKARVTVGDARHAKAMENPVYRVAYENRRLIQEVAHAVRSMRESTGLTQQQLATAIDSSQPTIARLERGLDQRVPRWDLLRRIGLVLGKQLKWVFEDATGAGQELVRVSGKAVRVEGAKPL